MVTGITITLLYTLNQIKVENRVGANLASLKTASRAKILNMNVPLAKIRKQKV